MSGYTNPAEYFGNGLMRALRYIDEHGAISQSQLAKKLNLTSSAINICFRKLAEEGVLEIVEKLPVAVKGRPTELWDIKKSTNFVIGVCFVSPYLLIGLSNLNADLLLWEKHDLKEEKNLDNILRIFDRFTAKAKEMTETRGKIRAVYAGMSGDLDSNGTVINDVNLGVLKGFNIEKYFETKHGLFARGHTHSYAYYYGEIMHLPPQTTTAVVNWDLGIGFVSGCDKSIFQFEDKASLIPRGIRDIGHMVIDKNGTPCACGKRGCLEAYAGGNAILKRLRHKNINSLDELIACAQDQDTEVLNELASSMSILGEQISWIVKFLGIERIIFTGPLSRIFQSVKKHFACGLGKNLSEQEIASLNPEPSSDPFKHIMAGACLMSKQLFLYPDLYLEMRNTVPRS